MSPTTVQQSIEALYQEAESVVADGGRMMAVIGSSPTRPAADLETVASIHAEARAKRTDSDLLPIKQRIQNLLSEAELEWSQSDETDPSTTEQTQESNSPATLNAQDEPAAKTPLSDSVIARTRDDVSAAMADIAAAVTAMRRPGKNGTTLQPDPAQGDGMDKDVLGPLIANTVRTVISEELPKLVKAALNQEMAERKAKTERKTKKTRAAKSVATAKVAVPKASAKKTTRAKVVGTKPVKKGTKAKSEPRK